MPDDSDIRLNDLLLFIGCGWVVPRGNSKAWSKRWPWQAKKVKGKDHETCMTCPDINTRDERLKGEKQVKEKAHTTGALKMVD